MGKRNVGLELTLHREKMYSQGGIFSITSRILVVDLLSSMKTWYLSRTLLINRIAEPRDGHRPSGTACGEVCKLQ